MSLPPYLVSVLTEFGGFWPRWIASIIVSLLVSSLVALGVEVSPEGAAFLLTTISVAISGAWGEYLKARTEKGVVEIQAKLVPVAPQVTPDGVPGPVTQAAVSATVEAAATIQDARAAIEGGASTQSLRP